MISIKRTCRFVPDKEPGKSDSRVRYRIMWNRNKVAFNVGYRIEVEKWSRDTQRCKNNTTHGKKKISASIINKEMQRIEEIAEAVFLSFEQTDTIPGPEEFRRAFNKLHGRITEDIPEEEEEKESLFDIYNTFLTTQKQERQWTASTYNTARILKSHLKEFRPDITFSDLDEKGQSKFREFLLTKKDLRNTTVLKYLKQLRTFLRWAKKDYDTGTAALDYYPTLKVTKNIVIFLEWEELMRVYTHKFSPGQRLMEEVRDVFCFCCFSSLRYSDVANLKRSDIYNEYMLITTIKTIEGLKIDLNDYTKAILEKYKNRALPDNRALPVPTMQDMNDLIKDIGQICKINQPTTVVYFKNDRRIEEVYPKYALLSTHAGRRTFICNALMLGIPVEVVMQWTGHEDYDSMKPYIAIADKTKTQAMQLFNNIVPEIKKQGQK